MTIAAGFRCNDGVVLCADSQMTMPGYLKYSESKIKFFTRFDSQPAFTFAGVTEFSNQAIYRLADKIRDAERSGTDFYEALASEAIEIHNRYFPLYPNSPLELSALIALRTRSAEGKGADGKLSGPVSLFKISGPIVTPVPSFDFIGGGMMLARSIAETLYQNGLTTVQGSHLAAYLLSQVKSHIDGCGGKSQILVLSDKGWWSPAPQNDFFSWDEIEDEYVVLQRLLKGVILGFANYELNQTKYEVVLEQFKKALLSRRARKMESFEEYLQFQSEVQAAEAGDVDAEQHPVSEADTAAHLEPSGASDQQPDESSLGESIGPE